MEKIEYYNTKEFIELICQKKRLILNSPGLFNLLAISFLIQICLENVSIDYLWIVLLLLFSNFIVIAFPTLQLVMFFKSTTYMNSVSLNSLIQIKSILSSTDFFTLFIVMFFNFKLMNITILSNYSWWFFSVLVCIYILPCFNIVNNEIKKYFKDKLN